MEASRNMIRHGAFLDETSLDQISVVRKNPSKFRRHHSLWLAILLAVPVLAGGQEPDHPTEGPMIARITAPSAAPLTRIRIKGYRLGANLDKGVHAIFVQGAAEQEVAATAHGYEVANLKKGIQELGVVVPETLQPGPCQVIVEVLGRRSPPFEFVINEMATAPVLSEIRPSIPRPTQVIWIDGSGFAVSDEVQLIDAEGRKHRVNEALGTSNPNTIALTLPKDFPAGQARIQLLEHRSGTNQQSNVLSFTVALGPTPLEIYGDWLMRVAPGQWVDLIVGSCDPLKGAERVEVAFRQDEQFLIESLKSTCDLRVQVPPSLHAGTVTLETRTLAQSETSQWSRPVTYELLEKPAPAKVYGIEIRPVRAEAAFRQNGRIVDIVTVSKSDYPRVRVPTDKLSQGLVEVLTRVWRGGVPSDWSFEHIGFDWPSTTILTDGTMGEVTFMGRIYLGPDNVKPLVVYPAETLVLEGTFPVANAGGIRVILRKDNQAAVVLTAMDGANPHRIKIKLPDTLDEGEWDVSLKSVDDEAEMRLPNRLKLLRTATNEP